MFRWTKQDEEFMKRALGLARCGGRVSPGPFVGAVLVRNGKIVGEGFYEKDGSEHAEICAMRGVGGGDLGDTIMYVTLEPCVRFEGKRHGSCAEALAQAGVKRVVVAAMDPHVAVQGKGISLLQDSGVQVDLGLKDSDEHSLNRFYRYAAEFGVPWVTLKLAASLDGRIALASGKSKYITGKESREYVHRLRADHSAVLTTAKTVLADDPHLGVRHVEGRNPVRLILDRNGLLTGKEQVFRDENILVLKEKDLRSALRSVCDQGFNSVLVEAGGRLAASLIHEHLVQAVVYFVAPKFIGSEGVSSIGKLYMKDLYGLPELQDISVRQLGRDIVIEGSLAQHHES